MTDARYAAWQILTAVAEGEPFERARERALAGLADRDRRLAHHIAAGVLRHQRSLDRELQQVLGGRWYSTEPKLKALLRVGAYQLRYLDRVPAYAALATTVETAKQLGRQQAGFVNAVLRRLAGRRTGQRAECGGAGRPAAAAADPIRALARQYSHPTWLVRRWADRYGLERTGALLRHHQAEAPLVIQPARWSPGELMRALEAAGVVWEEVPGGYGVRVAARRPSQLPGFAEGGFVVQGPGQARLVAAAGLPAGMPVWDCCAAPGGKAVALSRRGPVWASDLGGVRLRRLIETVRRAAPGVSVFAADARQPPLAPGSLAAVWLDAPCSATGTIARHPEIRWRLSPGRLLRLCRLQAELLEGVAPVVGPGGLLVYSTCSLEPEENERQVEAFLERQPAFRREQEDLVLLPTDSSSDGGFLAVLRKARCG